LIRTFLEVARLISRWHIQIAGGSGDQAYMMMICPENSCKAFITLQGDKPLLGIATRMRA
jgi:hypothetical protein